MCGSFFAGFIPSPTQAEEKEGLTNIRPTLKPSGWKHLLKQAESVYLQATLQQPGEPMARLYRCIHIA